MKTILAVFLLLQVTTGLGRYSCSEQSDEHNLSCEEEEKINIISIGYGYEHYICSSYCEHEYPYCECLIDIDRTVKSYLMDLCNGKRECIFKTPKPYGTCYKDLYDNRQKYYNRHKYSYIRYQCLTATTALPIRSTLPTSARVTHALKPQVYTDISTIKSTKPDNSRPQPSTESDTDKDRFGRTEAVLYTTDINNANAIRDTAVIAGSVVGCILLVILIFIVVVFIFKRKAIGYFIDSRFKDTSGVSNSVYEAPTDGYNNAIFRNDNPPSVNVVQSDDYNHLHDAKGDNSITTGNTYNQMGQVMGDYNHLHANNNSVHVDGQSGGTYNHLGMVNNKTPNSDYNHLNGLRGPDNVSEEVHNAYYNHLGDVKNEITKSEYDHLGQNKKSEISNDDYNHIGGITNEKSVDDYHHLCNVAEPVINDDDYNHIGDAKHSTVAEYELAHNGNLHVQEEQTPDDVQYEINDDDRGDYSNISDYINFPISSQFQN